MKICILSMQQVPNFGSLLQSYSLKRILEDMGHQVSFIDIQKNDEDFALLEDKQESFDKEFESRKSFFSKLKKIDRYAINRLKIKKADQAQNRMFDKFRQDFLAISDEDNDKEYDVCVIGSDEVFNCMATSPWGFTSQLFGNVKQAEKIITYGACCGSTVFEALPDKVADRIREAFLNVSAFSVRDENTYDFVNRLTDKQINYHLDPVLIGDFSKETENCRLPELPEKYCIVYSYYNRIHSKQEIQEIKKFCKEKKLEIVTVGAPQMWIKKHLVLTPFQALKVFEKAEFIITDTFHGTIFSAKYNGNFAVLLRESNNNKLGDLVSRLKIGKHYIKNMKELGSAYSESSSIDRIKDICQSEREKALDYLKENL